MRFTRSVIGLDRERIFKSGRNVTETGVIELLRRNSISTRPMVFVSAEWNRDFYPRLLAQLRGTQERQRRIKAGEVQVQTRYELRIGHADADLLRILQQRILAMSVADGLKLFHEMFARLGIQ